MGRRPSAVAVLAIVSTGAPVPPLSIDCGPILPIRRLAYERYHAASRGNTLTCGPICHTERMPSLALGRTRPPPPCLLLPCERPMPIPKQGADGETREKLASKDPAAPLSRPKQDSPGACALPRHRNPGGGRTLGSLRQAHGMRGLHGPARRHPTSRPVSGPVPGTEVFEAGDLRVREQAIAGQARGTAPIGFALPVRMILSGVGAALVVPNRSPSVAKGRGQKPWRLGRACALNGSGSNRRTPARANAERAPRAEVPA